VHLNTTCISCMYESFNHKFMCVMIYLCGLKMLEYISTLKKILTHNLCRGKCSDTTSSIPDIKSIHNINKMLEME
jgi:hypothetical protein